MATGPKTRTACLGVRFRSDGKGVKDKHNLNPKFAHMSHSLNSLNGVKWGIIAGEYSMGALRGLYRGGVL